MTIANVTWADEEDYVSVFEASDYKESTTEFKVDPLEAAVALKKLQIETGHYYDIQDPRVLDGINDSTKEQAEDIRKYYTKKFFWSNLTQTKPLSSFRSRLCVLLETHTKSLKSQDIGIFFKLPWFYEEDMAYEDFKKVYKTTDLPELERTYPKVKQTVTLKFLKTTKSWQKNRKLENFWFTKDDYLYNIGVTLDNPLRDMFVSMLAENETCTFETYLSEDRLDQLHFYKLYRFRFIKENNA